MQQKLERPDRPDHHDDINTEFLIIRTLQACVLPTSQWDALSVLYKSLAPQIPGDTLDSFALHIMDGLLPLPPTSSVEFKALQKPSCSGLCCQGATGLEGRAVSPKETIAPVPKR